MLIIIQLVATIKLIPTIMKLFLVAALAASASAFTVPEVKVPAVS